MVDMSVADQLAKEMKEKGYDARRKLQLNDSPRCSCEYDTGNLRALDECFHNPLPVFPFAARVARPTANAGWKATRVLSYENSGLAAIFVADYTGGPARDFVAQRTAIPCDPRSLPHRSSRRESLGVVVNESQADKLRPDDVGLLPYSGSGPMDGGKTPGLRWLDGGKIPGQRQLDVITMPGLQQHDGNLVVFEGRKVNFKKKGIFKMAGSQLLASVLGAVGHEMGSMKQLKEGVMKAMGGLEEDGLDEEEKKRQGGRQGCQDHLQATSGPAKNLARSGLVAWQVPSSRRNSFKGRLGKAARKYRPNCSCAVPGCRPRSSAHHRTKRSSADNVGGSRAASGNVAFTIPTCRQRSPSLNALSTACGQLNTFENHLKGAAYLMRHGTKASKYLVKLMLSPDSQEMHTCAYLSPEATCEYTCGGCDNRPHASDWVGAAVGKRLVCSPPTKVNRVHFPAGSPDLRMW
ncbi:hypothetical protein PR048_008812 [Dryococelus australis]|uniref:Uncharacterized protein n=1 Tax=Dryococelus australis TaxID=614101 RepID=A0ABQ9HZZ3_9NEOP|nr:hypothetical protein PR048_008812 [Dryococelus australis]